MAGLPRSDRMTLAALGGTAARYSVGNRGDTPRDEAVAAVHEITTDPRLLGIQAGLCAADPTGTTGPVVRLLVDAGADLAVATEWEQATRARLRGLGITYRPGQRSPLPPPAS